MSVHTYVQLGRDIDEKTQKYQKILDACNDAGIEPPSEVRIFFEELDDDDIELEDGVLWEDTATDAISKYNTDDARSIISVDLSKLPEDVKHVRFVNSY